MASIKQKSERKFKITASNGYHCDGKKICKARTITVPTSVPKRGIRQYVSHAAEEFEREFRLGYSEDAATPFETYAEKWLARQTRYAPSTLAGYRVTLQLAYPHIGHIPLCKIKPIALEKLCMELRKRQHHGKTIQEQTVQKYLMVVSTVLEDAKRNEIISRNPARMVSLPVIIKKEKQIPSLDEMHRLLEVLWAEPILYRTYYFLALYTGCWRGELCALTWSDTMKGGILIARSRGSVQGVGIVEKATKNYKSRIIYFNDWAHHLLCQLIYPHGMRPGFSLEDRIFVHKNGKPYHPDTFSKHLRRLYEKHGFSQDYTLHTLRHFYASYLMQNNISKQVTANLLGHGDTGFLERTYCHPQLEYKAEAAECITQLLCLPEDAQERAMDAG